jgi:hypothetical protein
MRVQERKIETANKNQETRVTNEKHFLILCFVAFLAVIHRKGKPEELQDVCLVARVGIEWEKCSLYSTVQGVMSDVADFNEFLLVFLRVGSVDRYEIMGMLGYNPNDLDLAANRQSGRRASPERPAFAKTTARSDNQRSPRVVSEAEHNEQSKLLAQLRYHYSQKDGLVPEVKETEDILIQNNALFFWHDLFVEFLFRESYFLVILLSISWFNILFFCYCGFFFFLIVVNVKRFAC